MVKSVRASIQSVLRKILKIGLLAYVILLFSFIGIKGSIQTSYAMKSTSLQVLVPLDTTTPIATPTPTPAPTPTPTPAPGPTQPPQATPIPPVGPIPTDVPSVPIDGTPVDATPTPTSTPGSATPTTVVAISTATATVAVSTTPPLLQSADNKGINALTLSLALGVGAPLLLISGGTFWLLLRWQINRRRLVLDMPAQASPWISSYEMQSSFYALQSASGAVNSIIPSTGASGVSISAPPTQPTYTPSDLRPVTMAFPQQMLTMHSNGIADYPLNGDLRPFPIDSLDLSLEVTRAIESNGNGHMPLLPNSPTALIDIPTSFMPSSPPISQAIPALPRIGQPPSIKDDSVLESVMRQAQLGLFALPGRTV